MNIYSASMLLPIAGPPIPGGAMVVDDGRILAVGASSDIKANWTAPVTEYPGCIIMPGLVNAHTHLELTHFPSWKIRKGIDYMPRTYVDWVIQVIKIKRALTERELELSLREGLRISLESGITTIGDILTARSLLPVYGETPLSGRVFFELIGQDPALYAESLTGLKKLLGNFSSRNFLPGISPHAPHTLSESLHREAKSLARKQGIPSTTHISESPDEAAFFFNSTGALAETLYPHIHWDEHIPPPRRATPTSWLDGLGVLDEMTLAVHCVHLTPDDAAIMRKRGVHIVLCPRSNERLNVGRAPIHLFKNQRIPLALGTDSLASNDSLSLWDEMRFLHNQFQEDFTYEQILRMATAGGAEALGLAVHSGTLEPGKRADFLVLRTDTIGAGENLYEMIVEGSQLVDVCPGGYSVQ